MTQVLDGVLDLQEKEKFQGLTHSPLFSKNMHLHIARKPSVLCCRCRLAKKDEENDSAFYQIILVF